MNRSTHSVHLPLIFVWVFCIILICGNKATAQKYAFAHYDIEDGLIQSQVNRLYQDNTHRLWIATLGGVSRFDGHDYYNISKTTGLPNNFVYEIYGDKKGTVWLGTNMGLSSIKDQKVYNYPIPADVKKTWVTHIAEEQSGVIWMVMGNHLYKAINNRMHRVQMPDSLNYSVSCIVADKTGSLYVSFIDKGIYKLENGKWVLYAPFTGEIRSAYVFKMQFDRFDSKKLYLLAPRGLFIAIDKQVSRYQNKDVDANAGPLMSFVQDYDDNLWLGTQRGAYFVSKQKTIHFTGGNGLTNNAVSDIYCDNDHNVWLGTNGSGMFRYEGAGHVIYDESQGINVNQVVMSMAHDKSNNILLGTAGGGIMKYSKGVLSKLWQPSMGPGISIIQSLFIDKDKNVWIGADHGGIWKYDGTSFKLISGTETRSINFITVDSDNTMWIATPQGCYYYENNEMTYLQGLTSFTSAIIPCGKDSILIGSQEGVKLVVNKKIVPGFKLGRLNASAILCIMQYKDKILIGTDDRGLFIWDKHNKLQNYAVKDGFKANSIYSLVTDNNGVIWVGTGRGINRLTIKPGSMECKVQQAGTSKDLVVEANQNAALYDDGKVFFGTTKGIIVFNTNIEPLPEKSPHVLIQGVKLFLDGNKGTQSIDEDPGANIKLSASQNHLVISFQGVYLKNPDEVTYQYKLTGLDDQFCWPVKSNTVDYPSLPPGKYTFEVKALSPEEKISSKTAVLKFEIVPPFYQKTIFRVLGLVFLVLLGFVIQYFLHQHQISKKQALETLKREEKQKLRQQTAEDFHDDLGNKLTRITVLSDVLSTKLDKDKIDQKNLVEQIRQNATALYNGTKDILWALDPKSDNLYETLMHVKETGIEMFQDVNIDFNFDGITESFNVVKLPMEYSRNITMIFKELLTNVLKHADAQNVEVSLEQPDKARLIIRITDDGNGYDENKAKRGHGLVNIRSRASRIGAQFKIGSTGEKGTTAELQVKLNAKM
ncbi:two-component regulator propeller domain-containing protein [Mucilaginibacter sp. OK098]|uniref:ligand-binding sensor domain-containing protein n=1 Tax=Mucilaginibacter sp. OK098 TaxID=1855297 RepID=UPI00091088D3|nr:sensor histidine kinase [Mucilaginibacter sp. OK098]SHL89024.1 Two component regulator propeller [Mucilaginibacter sp. OK098]